MFAAVVEAGKLESALDLVERLHLEKSFEIAMTIADHHRKLVDFIEDVKDRRFPHDSIDYTDENDDDDGTGAFNTDPLQTRTNRPRISLDDNSFLKRTKQESQPQRQVRSKLH
jgi:chromosome transmission fidelity protein 4